jgi:type VI secretion system secreted protein VgrG
MATYTQENRLIAIDTPLGEDVLLLRAFTAHEGISQLFSFDLDLLSETSSIPFDKIVGQRVTISVVLADGEKRYINGFVSRFAQSGGDARFSSYRAEVVPWLWFLTRTADCRIFQHMTTPDIVTKIFTDLGFTDFKNMLTGNFEPREYCVQYRESDFNFVSRLMEEDGIFYFFEHEKDKHTLVLANSPSIHRPCPGQPEARCDFNPGAVLEEDVVTTCQMVQELRPGRYGLTDYNFETPNTSLAVNVSSTVDVGANERFEVYDYPGEYLKKAQGESLVKVRMEEEEVPHCVITGESTCRAFTPGYRFGLQEHYREDLNQPYILTQVHHTASVEASYSGRGGEVGERYSNRFSCIPFKVPYRPPRVTPKPVVQGPQTAMVVGKAGEEIWTDKYGRVKVQFHWDREGKRDENSSCWVRVSQNWAGKRWGAMFLPRIGQEVIVDFLEGDPDRPIITGRVYNGESMPPYELPREQTKSSLKTLSSKDGGGFNEIRLEDKKGEEQVFIHAERNQDIRVKNDLFETVGRDTHLITERDQFALVKGDKHHQVKGDQNGKVDGTVSLQAGIDMQEKVGMKYALDAGMEIHLKAGMNVVIEAGMSITLKAGAGFIVVGPAGVTVSGIPILLNSGGAAGAGSGSSPEAPQPPKEADTAEPGEKDRPLPFELPAVSASSLPPVSLAQVQVLREAAQSGVPFCEKCEALARLSGSR